MQVHSQTHNNNDFIRGWYLDNLDTCDQIIDYFKNNNNKFLGRSSNGVDATVKDSTDCYLQDAQLANLYVTQLMDVASEYINLYPFVNFYSPWGINDNINIQEYKPSQGYHKWHTERSGVEYQISTRHMVFMTYLNDITDGGETEFFHQKIKVKPEKGLTLIWPADWTFTHRGVPSSTETKYIVTGWFNYFGENNGN
jgi:hypothetical protein